MNYDETRKSLLRGSEIDISMGTTIQLRLLGMESRCRSTFVGMETNDYLIIRIPMVPGILSRLRQGNRVTVSYVNSGRIWGFQSSLLGHIMRPMPLMFLSYPKSVETYDLRKEPRVSCLFPANAEIAGNSYQGVILDISKGGCRFSSENSNKLDISKVELGEPVNLVMQWMGIEEEQILAGNVRSKSQDLSKTVVGIQFDPSQSDAGIKIKAYVEEVVQFA